MVEQAKNGVEDLTRFAMDVVHRSGDEALSYYGKGLTAIKFDEGLVTEAELKLDEFFEDQLSAYFPEHRIFNRNQGKRAYTHKGDGAMWVYDPLDGARSTSPSGR